MRTDGLRTACSNECTPRTIPKFHPSASGPQQVHERPGRPAGGPSSHYSRGARRRSHAGCFCGMDHKEMLTDRALKGGSARQISRRSAFGALRDPQAVGQATKRGRRRGARITAGAQVTIVRGTRKSAERPAGRRKRRPLCLDARLAKDRIVDATRLVVGTAGLCACLVMSALGRPFSRLPRHQGKAGKEKMDRGDQGRKDRAGLGTLDRVATSDLGAATRSVEG